jgi:uncharacterized protein YegJ (DUF2314 family)
MYTLLDGIAQNKKFRKTFEIPSKNEIDQLTIGDYVKLCFQENEHGERMWARVEIINGDFFQGILDNEPTLVKTVKHGDIVAFERKNIIGVL